MHGIGSLETVDILAPNSLGSLDIEDILAPHTLVEPVACPSHYLFYCSLVGVLHLEQAGLKTTMKFMSDLHTVLICCFCARTLTSYKHHCLNCLNHDFP